MKSLGVVEGTSADRHVIVLCTEAPDIGCEVFDGGKRRVGRVYKVFGPVDAPYASVTPETGMRILAGSKLFVNGGLPNGKKRRH